MPKGLMDFLGYVIYFWINEGTPTEPIHVHVAKGKPTSGATKIWITKTGVMLDHNDSKIPRKDLAKLLSFINDNRNTLIAKWAMRFEQVKFKRDDA
ncbi:MAG: DUF4160 domain-containing protein [Selenomonadaceae bacterium]|nr:DUF4160 domain-containing protein [Selenomonadaceae bacterium]